MTGYLTNFLSAIVAATVISSVFIPNAIAEDAATKGVVELFTSQGCSSCPPADAVLGELVEQGDVVALAYHVDYWNYLGWKDTLSSKQSTDRQYDYARTLGRSSVYTPQVVINGRDHINGADKKGINAKIDAFEKSGRGLIVPVSARLEGDKIKINVGEGQGKANIVIVYFDSENTIQIKRGENRGKALTYWHSVRDVQTIGMWDGKAMEVDLPATMVSNKGYDGCAILLQTMKSDTIPGAIIGASVMTDGAS